MIVPKLCYTVVFLWLVLRGVLTKERSQLKLFYATTKLLGPPCFYKESRVKKYVTLLAIHRVIHRVVHITFATVIPTFNAYPLG